MMKQNQRATQKAPVEQRCIKQPKEGGVQHRTKNPKPDEQKATHLLAPLGAAT